MDSLAVAVIVSDNLQNSYARSALPDAPVVPDSPRRVRVPRAAGPRRALSAALVRAARAVEPAQPATPACTPAH
jgi:hypothetical protein